MRVSEAYSEASPAPKIELFAKIVEGFQPLTVFEKNSVWVLNTRLNTPRRVG